MSVKIMSAIFEDETPGLADRLIRLSLVDHADDTGHGDPSKDGGVIVEDHMSREPSPEQTLAAQERVFTREIWEPEQPADTWQHVFRVIQHRVNEAAE